VLGREVFMLSNESPHTRGSLLMMASYPRVLRSSVMSRTILSPPLHVRQWLQMNMTTVPLAPRRVERVARLGPGKIEAAAASELPAGVVRLTMASRRVMG